MSHRCILYSFPELFSKPVLTITPPEVFEREQFTVTCSSSEFASERIERRDVTFFIYRYKQKLHSHNGTYITTASTETNGNYTCTAQVNDTIKWSRSVFLTAKGRTASFSKFKTKHLFASSKIFVKVKIQSSIPPKNL